MSTDNESCMVALTKQCNDASATKNAINSAIDNASLDLLTLSARILARNKSNWKCNSPARTQLQRKALKKGCIVAGSNQCNVATDQLRKLITKVSQKYGGDDSHFLTDYINDVIRQWGSPDLDKAMVCFESLL